MTSDRLGLQLVSTVAAAVVVAATSASAQGDNGFLRGAGKTDVALTYTSESYDHFWVGNQRVKDPGVGEITRESLSLYVAHGLTDDMDVVMAAAYVDAENDGFGAFDDERQLQDLSLGVKWRAGGSDLLGGRLSYLLAPSVKVPMTHYESNNPTAIGDGQVDVRARGILHYQSPNGFFAAVETGFDYRAEGPPNETLVNVSLGQTFFNRVTVSPFLTITNSIHGKNIGQDDFPAVEEDIERLGVSLYGRVNDQVGVTLGWKNTLDGRNTGDLTGWWLGVVFKI